MIANKLSPSNTVRRINFLISELHFFLEIRLDKQKV